MKHKIESSWKHCTITAVRHSQGDRGAYKEKTLRFEDQADHVLDKRIWGKCVFPLLKKYSEEIH